jgi:hypothetical protein
VGILVGGRIKYVPRPGYVEGSAPALSPAVALPVPLVPSSKDLGKTRREKAPRATLDPKLLKKVRELRDRCVEAYRSGELALPDGGKYQVTRRALPAPKGPAMALPRERGPLLPAA